MRFLWGGLLFFSAIGNFACADSSVDVVAARLNLKNYGLAYCMANQFSEKSDMRADVGVAVGIYGFMGGGMHIILQDEDTLETLHDPYRATKNYVNSVYDQVHAQSKYSDKKVVFFACLKIYNSKEFDDFIESQDKYIRVN